MSLEYAIEYPCEMRRQYQEETLRLLARTGSVVSRMVNETLDRSLPPSEESIQFTTRYADDLEKLEQIASYCRTHCPAHLDENLSNQVISNFTTQTSLPNHPHHRTEPIGCLGRIHYPIEGRFERFVANRLQLLYDTLPAEQWPHLLHILIDPESPFDGEGTKELRRVTTAEGLRFFELRVPISLSRKSARLTTDNVFDLFSGFTSADQRATSYQRDLPPLALADYAEFLEALLISDLNNDEFARLCAQSSSYSQFIRFTHAVRLAQKLGVRLLLD